MKLDDLQPAPGSVKRRKRIGRGPGSGKGIRSGRGNKGDKARGQSKLGFEGGQTPLHRRLPKQRGLGTGLTARGFNSGYFKTRYAIANISDLEDFEAGSEITPELLLQNRVIKDMLDGVKILGDGELTKVLTVKAHKFSKTAQQAIARAGGTVILLDKYAGTEEVVSVDLSEGSDEEDGEEAEGTEDETADTESTDEA
ncbi:MAG: 50S ribosomal protein L15 [Armatimonadaceae bacterium]